jgi:ATP-dependent DNA helicase RecG
MEDGIEHVVAKLRKDGGDWTEVEVKKAANGFPESIAPSLSALSNLPGGGLVILGLDEENGFIPVKLENPQQLKQSLGHRAREFDPPVRLTFEDHSVDDLPVVVARVHECDPSQKPCRLASSGKAWVRSFDGDYELSTLEEQAFLAARTAPNADSQPILGASKTDLDETLIASWIETAQKNRPALRQFTDRDELLRRTGVVIGDGVPTLAGLLVLGRYPQQFFPQLVIRVAMAPGPEDPAGTRVSNQKVIDGPIPTMLAQVMDWARDSFRTRVIHRGAGQVVDESEYPLEAFRELIANTMVHRDYSSWALGQAIEVRLLQDGLIITNPGGLYGITVSRLGANQVTSARNQRIVSLCQDVRLPNETRVIEALATGIPTVIKELTRVGLPMPRYWDTGIKFTVRLDQRRQEATVEVLDKKGKRTIQDQVYERLEKQTLTAIEISENLDLSLISVRTALSALTKNGKVTIKGGRGKRSTYTRAFGNLP